MDRQHPFTNPNSGHTGKSSRPDRNKALNPGANKAIAPSYDKGKDSEEE